MCVCAFLRPEAFSSFLLYCRSNDIYIASRRSYRVRVLPLSRIFPSLPRRVGSSSFLDCPTLGVLSIPPLSILYIKRRRRMKREGDLIEIHLTFLVFDGIVCVFIIARQLSRLHIPLIIIQATRLSLLLRLPLWIDGRALAPFLNVAHISFKKGERDLIS